MFVRLTRRRPCQDCAGVLDSEYIVPTSDQISSSSLELNEELNLLLKI